MDTLDPIHVSVLIHSLIELPISKNTLDGGNLKYSYKPFLILAFRFGGVSFSFVSPDWHNFEKERAEALSFVV